MVRRKMDIFRQCTSMYMGVEGDEVETSQFLGRSSVQNGDVSGTPNKAAAFLPFFGHQQNQISH